ncbi:hypothetical protein [Phaeocystidibacter marisrubri]|uniref:Uncharacterized protein n=1 Tax=Phaeocystidibacter marisrubri TaxID=1577780 RepID=A0A6L3ZCK4_9FLAO|nr:hypothetical protein [Phaeocystidibacter marisrubri]KAB2815575.1 hypothetical protein F8C82_07680 [Phaeocystidibacter marisrubri]GGH64614.1 hypothetical protein GCM10011318_00800 [Phaeocystidibacter marisrubri]
MKIIALFSMTCLVYSCGVYTPEYELPYGKAYTAPVDPFQPVTITNDKTDRISLSYARAPVANTWYPTDQNIQYGTVSFIYSRQGEISSMQMGARYGAGAYNFRMPALAPEGVATYHNLGYHLGVGMRAVEIAPGWYLSPFTINGNIDIGFGAYDNLIKDADGNSYNDSTAFTDVRSKQMLSLRMFTELRYDINQTWRSYLRIGYGQIGTDYFDSKFLSPVESRRHTYMTLALQFQKFGVFATQAYSATRQEITPLTFGFFWEF